MAIRFAQDRGVLPYAIYYDSGSRLVCIDLAAPAGSSRVLGVPVRQAWHLRAATGPIVSRERQATAARSAGTARYTCSS
jgi:hypothetical protein